MSDEQLWQDYLAAQQQLRNEPDDLLIPVGKASVYLHTKKSQLDKWRLTGEGPAFSRTPTGRIFYSLGALRDYVASAKVHRTTSEYGNAYGFLSGADIATASEIPFWADSQSHRLIGPVYGPLSPDFREAFLSPDITEVWLTPPEALLVEWTDEERELDAWELWETNATPENITELRSREYVLEAEGRRRLVMPQSEDA